MSARGDFLIWSFSGKTRSIRLSVACTPAPSDSESLAIRCRLQMFWWLIKNKKQKSKSNLLFKQQSILIASGFVLSQVIIFIKLWYFFPPVDVHNVHIPDWIQRTDGSEMLPFFFFKQPPHRQVEKMVHTSTSQLEANQRKWF